MIDADSAAPAPAASVNPVDAEATQAAAVLSDLAQKKVDLEQQLLSAKSSMDWESEGKIAIQLNDLNFERLKAEIAEADASRRAAQVAENAKAQEHIKIYEEGLAKAVSSYPDAAVEGSALWNEMAAIDAALEQQGNPLFSDPNKGFKIAQMAANNLAIAPKLPGRPAQAAHAPAAVPAQVKPAVKPRPTNGGQSSNGQQVNVISNEQVANLIRTPADLERYAAQFV
jgi:hypothetical protein